MVTDAQVRRLREKRMSGKTLAAAAAAAGMSERTARQWQSGALPSTAKAVRWWRTREDPFAEVWESEMVPQLVADTDGRLQVLALFKALCRRHLGRFSAGAAPDAPGRAVRAPAVRVGAQLQQVDLCGAGGERDVRGAGGRPAGCAARVGRVARAIGRNERSRRTQLQTATRRPVVETRPCVLELP